MLWPILSSVVISLLHQAVISRLENPTSNPVLRSMSYLSRETSIEDNRRVILDSVKNPDKLNPTRTEAEEIDSILYTRANQEQNSKAFGLMDNFGPVLSKWQNKSDTFNPTKTNKSRVSEVIDPSITSGIASFAVEASERHNRLKPNISDEFLSRQFRASGIFSDSDRADGN